MGLADRLLVALRQEIAGFEQSVKEQIPTSGDVPAATARGRFEALAQMTKTLEKLLDLKRVERLLAETNGSANAAETMRLKAETLRRLRALDARRGSGAGLADDLAQACA